ncbi:hypothetical protein Pyrde_0501 [Pyrodictium delaneyi]|uniref:Sjogrens syndrome scleroderma autoantigen 1 n=1 Tax=Pyrodictium delaneyi TaxID=1273541 RepID=A0A0P0N2K1_9CREN|nr:hypothetical protein Pyrde_0501 [Pyrodictium delaneyi]
MQSVGACIVERRSSPEVVRRMADLLRAGAAMLSERCPLCGLPLFRLKSGEIVCPVHGRVYIVRDESEVSKVTVQGVLEELEKFVAHRISEVIQNAERSPGSDVAEALRSWLDILERTERILNMVTSPKREEERKETNKKSSSGG